MMGGEILSVQGIDIVYKLSDRQINAVRKVNLSLKKGEILGLVGESGCGKSTLAHALLRLIYNPGSITDGSILYFGDGEGKSVLEMKPPQLRRYRWKEVSMIFQGSMNSLNPTMRVRDQILDVMLDHDYTLKEALSRVDNLLTMAGISPRVKNMFPHELSGGMKQRVNIAIALACDPKLVIADEPTTALDVVVQDQIVRKLRELKESIGLTVMFITHDIALVGSVADRIAVMYAGRVVEISSASSIFNDPKHPYTIALLDSIPRMNDERERVEGIPGHPPDLSRELTGCSFAERCRHIQSSCREKEPELIDVGKGHEVACFFAGDLK